MNNNLGFEGGAGLTFKFRHHRIMYEDKMRCEVMEWRDKMS